MRAQNEAKNRPPFHEPIQFATRRDSLQAVGQRSDGSNRFTAEILGRGLAGKDLRAGLGKFEADEPVAGDAVAIHFRCREFPATGGLESQIGEILARPGGIEFGLGDISRRLDVDADRHADFAVNGAASFVGDVGQDLFQDFTVRGRGGGGFGRVGRWKRVGP